MEQWSDRFTGPRPSSLFLSPGPPVLLRGHKGHRCRPLSAASLRDLGLGARRGQGGARLFLGQVWPVTTRHLYAAQRLHVDVYRHPRVDSVGQGADRGGER